jgi:hypothetical protein
MLGRNDQARADYDEALALYKQADDRFDQAIAPQQAAAYFVEAARVFEMVGMPEQHDAALKVRFC